MALLSPNSHHLTSSIILKPNQNCDILLHAGDLTNKGTFAELQAQLNWLNTLPYTHKIIIGGNHDRILDASYIPADATIPKDKDPTTPFFWSEFPPSDLKWGSITYLENSSTDIQIRGRILKVFGSPYVHECGRFAFQYLPVKDFWKGKIPEGTDIVLTHRPPKGHLDMGEKGCGWLGRELERIRPRLVVWRHIHQGRGVESVDWGRVQRGYEGFLRGEKSWMMVVVMVLVWIREFVGWRVFGRMRRGMGVCVNAAVGGNKVDGGGEGVEGRIVEI